MKPDNRYGSLAATVYHLDKPIGRSFGDIEFYRDLLGPPRGSVLEPACGNGRVLIPLLEAGYDIYGFDASEEMLAHCLKACRRRGLRAALSRQRFEDFAYEQSFEALILPAGSFQLVTDAALARRVLRRLRRALLPRGRLILDLDPLSGLAEPEAALRAWQSGEDRLTLSESAVKTDFVRQMRVSELTYERWRDGELVERQAETFSLRFWGVLEMELALREAGFADIAVHADYRRGAAPERSTGALTFEASAPPA
ncbi:class I SAM-dependent methyltransferase [Afifella pfennigii]|uniref:class I SAM-dependent methyltransferase n=1 Tax=Afifella pfennigii TaxID=209897 RepID=UPI00047BA7CF|nr:class I SAM-dependent methyltransferase [Afifella pfennigii]